MSGPVAAAYARPTDAARPRRHGGLWHLTASAVISIAPPVPRIIPPLEDNVTPMLEQHPFVRLHHGPMSVTSIVCAHERRVRLPHYF